MLKLRAHIPATRLKKLMSQPFGSQATDAELSLVSMRRLLAQRWLIEDDARLSAKMTARAEAERTKKPDRLQQAMQEQNDAKRRRQRAVIFGDETCDQLHVERRSGQCVFVFL